MVILGFALSAGTLDLPPVEVLVNDLEATVRFLNPMRLRPMLQWAKDTQTADPLKLTFDVTEHNVRGIQM